MAHVMTKLAFMMDHNTGRRKAPHVYGEWKPNMARLERKARRTVKRIANDPTLQDIVDKRNAKLEG